MSFYRKAGDLLRKRWPQKAIQYYQKAILQNISKSESIDLLLSLAVLYDEIGHEVMAEETYQRASRLDSADPRPYYGLGVLFDIRKDYEKAIIYYQEAIKLKPDYLKAHYFLALILDDLGEKEKAIEHLRIVTELDPNHFWAHNNLGSIYEELNQNDKALQAIKKALSIDPNQYKALFNAGVVMHKMGYDDKAVQYYLKSIHQMQKYPYSYLNLAVLYKEKGDFVNALRVADEGIQHNPETSFLYFNRACFRMHLNQENEAVADLRKAIELHPDLLQEALHDEDLQPLKNLAVCQDLWDRAPR